MERADSRRRYRCGCRLGTLGGPTFSGGTQRTRIRRLEADLLEERRKTGEFSATSKNVSEAVVTLMNVLPLAQQNPPPRAVARKEPEAEQNENLGGQQ